MLREEDGETFSQDGKTKWCACPLFREMNKFFFILKENIHSQYHPKHSIHLGEEVSLIPNVPPKLHSHKETLAAATRQPSGSTKGRPNY